MNTPEELIVTNLILQIIKDYINPKIVNVLKTLRFKNEKPETISNCFNEYLKLQYEKYSLLDTLVFPNKQTLFKNLYEPLTLVALTSSKRKISIKIDKYPKKLFSDFYRIIIEDTAGMGKSTILKNLFLSIIDVKSGIPILIEFR